MLRYRYIRGFHHKPPYKALNPFYCCALPEKNTSNNDTQIMAEGNPDNAATVSINEDQPVNTIMDAVGRITDAAARLIEATDAKTRNSAEPCGLLCFREWWELVEVKICVGGKLISGIPIFIKEDVLRVVDNDHSYFIPLNKVDYILTKDGLCSS